MPFHLIRQDITKIDTDAIVNAANTSLLAGGGVCGAIFKAAGERSLSSACKKLAPIKTRQAVATSGFKLPAKYIIHTAGPIYSASKAKKCRQQLKDCYLNSLKLADSMGLTSIAFPLISSGIYGYPKAEALEVAQEAINEFLQNSDSDMEVLLAVFDQKSFEISTKLLDEVESYIDQNYVDQSEKEDIRYRSFPGMVSPSFVESTAKPDVSFDDLNSLPLDHLLDDLEIPFNEYLLKLIDSKGKTDSEVYKKAKIDRKLFSKIRSNPDYTPRKRTILALAFALELTLEETQELLERAGYALSHAKKFDVIIEFFIQSSRFNIFEVNDVLFKYGLPGLGS